ncbi:MAG: hypothetical protein KDA32_08420 [Phycisphaerales bacterium]|nr:hypothetical protein [Phycisphaerales bacterium]
MVGKIVAFLEAHVEKMVLGGAVLFVLYLAWGYLIATPHTTKLDGKDVTAGEIAESVLASARTLDSAVKNAKADPFTVEPYATELRKRQDKGILTSDDTDKPAIPPVLARAAEFGRKIEVPGLEQSSEAGKQLVLATPMPPMGLELRAGRSVVIPDPLKIDGSAPQAGFQQPGLLTGRGPGGRSTGGGLINIGPRQVPGGRGFQDPTPSFGSPAPEPGSEIKTRETPWVTVGAYYEKGAQEKEFLNANYAQYRAKPYVVRTEAQRQELLANGEWSEWADVTPGDAMPKVDLPDIAYDPSVKRYLNKPEVAAALQLIKTDQERIMQPPFFVVRGGDEWELPPLDGLPIVDDEEEEVDEGPKINEPAQGPRQPIVAPPSNPTVRGGRGIRGGGSGPTIPGGGSGIRNAGPSGGDPKKEARKQAIEDWNTARQHMRAKEYAAAIEAARKVVQAGDGAPPLFQKRARKLIKFAESRAGTQAGPTPRVAEQPFVTRPDDKNTEALWFHDDTVTPGKTYRYRLRVVLWNRYAEQDKALKDAEDARKLLVSGEWSIPSEPVTVPPLTHFFLAAENASKGTARFDVWKWFEGRWIKESFDVAVGEVIGGVRKIKTGETDSSGREVRSDVDFTTGAVLLDVRFDENIEQRQGQKEGYRMRTQQSSVAVCLNPADGRVIERVRAFDRYDPTRQELEDEAELF